MKMLRVATLLSMAAALSSCGGDTASETPKAGGMIAYYTVGQPATMSSPWGDGSSSHNPAVAVRFTPPSYPVTVKSVTIYAKNATGVDQQFNLYGYRDLATQSPLFAPVLAQSIPDTGTTYLAKTVAVPETPVFSGSFYIAVEWVTKPLAAVSGANSFYIITDGKLDYPGTNFMRFSANAWHSYESMSNVTAGDLGIVVNY